MFGFGTMGGRAVRPMLLAAALAVTAACVADVGYRPSFESYGHRPSYGYGYDDGFGYGYGAPPSRFGYGGSVFRDRPGAGTLSRGHRDALIDGCQRRYDNPRKIRQCLNGTRHTGEALMDGCVRRYPNDMGKARRCMGSW